LWDALLGVTLSVTKVARVELKTGRVLAPGVGYETARALAASGARVVLACRDEARGAAAAVGRDSLSST